VHQRQGFSLCVLGALATTLSLVLAGLSGTSMATLGIGKKDARVVAYTKPVTPPYYSGGHLMTADPSGGGFWTVNSAGSVMSDEGAPELGSPAASGLRLEKPIVGMAATPDGRGYWLVAADGGIFTYGDAQFYGSTGAMHLNQPIVGMAATPDGAGYWLVAADGGIFTFGDAPFYGSTGSMHLNQPIVGMAATPGGAGYWLVAADGGIFTFGNAQFYGSTGSMHLVKPIVGMAATPGGAGYWLVAADGGIFTFGNAQFYGSLGGAGKSVLGIEVETTTPGYTLVESDGTAVSLPSGDVTPPSDGDGSASSLNDCQPKSTPVATADTSLDNTFTTMYGPGWIGGDGTYSTKLPDGSEAFAFSDTLIGTAQPNGEGSLTGLVHNSELVGPLSDLTADIGGTTSAPQLLIPDANGPGDEWQVAATDVENGEQLIFVNDFADGGGTYTGRSGIAVMSIPADGVPALSSIVPIPTDSHTQWGNALMQSGGYTYIYGSDIDVALNVFDGMKVARVPLGQSLDTSAWQYWNGSGWVSGEANAVPEVSVTVLTGVAPQPSGNGYVAVSIPGWAGGDTTVDLSYACAPSGPWSAPKAVYEIPEIAWLGETAYIPTFHTELSTQGDLVVSYNINNVATLDLLTEDVHHYQPKFIQLAFAS
jgi:hypothetical protein